MTVFRLATATVLFAGLALPVLAQGTTSPAPSVPGAVVRSERAPMPAAPAPGTSTLAQGAAAPTSAVPNAVVPAVPAQGAATRAMTPRTVVTPQTAMTAQAATPRAESGTVEARPGRMDATRVERTERRSHHRLASATRMERPHAPHGQAPAGEAAPDAPR
jgi:hypothetical protein